ncbi:MAG TPA: TlpA disulfide reductase family protein [Elusimicrobiales bacterium]|nr:TlpA disulfide reductase family protein [Elusimicrobiales bacterium]
MNKLNIAALSLALLACGCSAGGEAAYDQKSAPQAPEFTLATVPPGTFRLAERRGKVLLLEFMSYNCPACDGANAPLVELHRKYEAKGFGVVAVSIDADSDMAGYAKRYGLNYPIALDIEQKAAMDYRLRGTPSFVLIDKQGKIRRHWAGFAPELIPFMESSIEQLLQEPA